MVETTLPNGLETFGRRVYIANFVISLDVFEFFFRFGLFFLFLIFFGVLCILGPTYCGLGATIRIGREIRCLPYAGFLLYHPKGRPKPKGKTSPQKNSVCLLLSFMVKV